ncbi:MAG: hypothetical protein P4L31_01115 [Candidatus Babeliales bacterium]|nr:hypothetical protein [Candidatus Babeliales bacterium]
MKNIKKISYYSIFFAIQLCNYSYTVGENAGKNAVKKLDEVIKENMPAVKDALSAAATNAGVNAVAKADEALQNHMPAVNNASADFGKNFGVGFLKTLGEGVTGTGTLIGIGWAKSSVAVGTVATKTAVAAKATATVIVTAPATPYVVAGAVVVGAGYGGFKVYRHYNPTLEQMVLNARAQTEVVEAQNDLAKKQQEQQEIARKQQKMFGRAFMKQELNKCFLSNQASNRNPSGIPTPCQEAFFNYAAASSSEQSDKAIKDFTQSFPAPKTNSWWPFYKA